MRRVLALALLLPAGWGCGSGAPDDPAPLVVFAAASLTEVLTDAAHAFERETRRRVQLNFAASSILARQIEAGAPADLFLSANRDWVEYVVRHGRARSEDRALIASNRLVVVVRRGHPLPVRLSDLAALSRIALADPAAAPAGVYAREMLERAGLWRAVEPRVIPSLDVRAALELAESGAVDAAVVYGSDAIHARAVVEAPIVPAALQPHISYEAAVTRRGRRPETAAAARAFLESLRGPAGVARFVRFGFTPPEENRP